MRIFVLAALVLAASGAAVAQTSTAPRWQAGVARSVVPAPSASAQALASAARCGEAPESGGDTITQTQIAPGTVHRPADPARDQQRAYTDLVDNAAQSANAFAKDNTTESSARDRLDDAAPC